MHYVKDPEQITLGEFINYLEEACSYVHENYGAWRVNYDREKEKPLDFTYPTFDFAGASPKLADPYVSYRGHYEDLSMQVNMEAHTMPTAEQLLLSAKRSVGKVFTGYKGGAYRASLGTPLWVADSGKSTDTVVTGVAFSDCAILILTKVIMSEIMISDNFYVRKAPLLEDE